MNKKVLIVIFALLAVVLLVEVGFLIFGGNANHKQPGNEATKNTQGQVVEDPEDATGNTEDAQQPTETTVDLEVMLPVDSEDGDDGDSSDSGSDQPSENTKPSETTKPAETQKPADTETEDSDNSGLDENELPPMEL